MDQFLTLEDFVHRCWDLLHRATVKRRQPFATPVVGTIAGGSCRMRTVILRRVEVPERRLFFFSDARAAKMEDLWAGSPLSWHFYDRKRALQIRAGGAFSIHHEDEVARRWWQQQAAASRRNYASVRAPGTVADGPVDGVPAFWRDDLPPEETDFAFQRFAMVVGTIDHMDCLQLHPEGHRRAVFRWAGTDWHGQWVLP